MVELKHINLICVVLVLSGPFCGDLYGGVAIDQTASARREARDLFAGANSALAEGRFAEAHIRARELISRYAGDPQIWLYVHFYVHTFYFVDEDFQEGMLRPMPAGIEKRIEQLKAKSEKSVIYLVTLAWVADAESGGLSIAYLNEILEKYPQSVWAECAEMELGMARIGGYDTVTKERYVQFYDFGVDFMRRRPNSHLMPRILCITANSCRHISNDKRRQDEAVRLYRRVLDAYPEAEYYCASARRDLRRLLGDDYEEEGGFSEERDRTTTLFYCHSPQLEEYKKYTAEYIVLKEQLELDRQKETEAGTNGNGKRGRLSIIAYMTIAFVGIAAIAGVFVLIKKK